MVYEKKDLPMRTLGKITQWDAKKRMGYLQEQGTDSDIVVPASSLPKGGVDPKIGERVIFELAVDKKQQRYAKDIVFPDRDDIYQKPDEAGVSSLGQKTAEGVRHFLAIVGKLAFLLVLIALAYWGYQKYGQQVIAYTVIKKNTSSVNAANFHCDSREFCAQMTSCEEAMFFLEHCPNAKMDGDGNGVPCEKQWCGGKALLPKDTEENVNRHFGRRGH
jgi:cold shock CspA family protein